jgi:hypothetical protein
MWLDLLELVLHTHIYHEIKHKYKYKTHLINNLNLLINQLQETIILY